MRHIKVYSFIIAFALSAASMVGCGEDSGKTSDSNLPDEDQPGTDNPGTDNPGTDNPGTDNPGTDNPGTDNPGTDNPGTDNPGTDNPGTDNPGTDNPDQPSTPEPCANVDLQTDHDNCGICGQSCNAYEVCSDGACTCAENYLDCDGDGRCDTYGACICNPGDEMPCYDGPYRTENVGACHAGTMTCKIDQKHGGTYYDSCKGQVTPSYDYICDPTQPDLDVDCNGLPDATQDEDGDGYAICNELGDAPADCCDNTRMCNTSRPDLINPGRIDCFGNQIDDNCSGKVDDNPDILCGTEEAAVADCKIKERSCSALDRWQYNATRNVSASGALSLAKAMDVCLDVVTKESHMPGLIEFSIGPASDYNIGIDPKQFNIKDGMYDINGTNLIPPREGNTFVILSSGIAGDVKTELNALGKDDAKLSLGGSIPEPYRSAHKNQLQTHPLCASGGADIYDTVRLHLKIRAPKTAQGFSFDFRFFSREYPYYVCSAYNDFFLALLTDDDGKALPGVAEDGNISFDKDGNPVSVNNAFFTTCAAAPCTEKFAKPMEDHCPAMLSCDATTNTCGGNMCKDGADALAAYYPDPYTGAGGADPADKRGGATAWLTTKAPVQPGEVFNLDFYIWDTGDLKFDSSVILDNFQWICSETTVGTDFATGGGVVN